MTNPALTSLNNYTVALLLGVPRFYKRILAVSLDAALCAFTVWLAFYLRLGEIVEFSGNPLAAILTSIILAIPIFIVSGLYRAIFRYSGWPALTAIAKAVGIYGLFYFVIFTLISIPDVPRTVGIIQPLLLLFFAGASRVIARLWLGDQYRRIIGANAPSKILIYGAGETGRQIAAAMASSPAMDVVGFLDDDPLLQRRVMNGKTIYRPEELGDLVHKLGITDVLLAMTNISRKRRNEIINQISAARVAVRTLPSVTDLARGKITISDLREPDIDDLLGREPVVPDLSLLSANVAGKVVAVTGAGGSIGSELCRQIVHVGPAKLLLIDQSEFALYEIHQELIEKVVGREITLVPLLASVQDRLRIGTIMGTWRPDTVYHAAAYKHVPIVEHNLTEGIKNNVLGTLRTALAAAEHGVGHFVLISTDKAVRPTNVMGASKRLAEMVLQALAEVHPHTKFAMVRFGNVLGSSGSVVPKFRQQILEGGPITLTHPEITRYFMTIPEAAQLVIQAGAMTRGGDVFLLDMGQSVKIIDLARRMVELSGLTIKDETNPDGDIEIEITGLRPGEKLFEELLIGDNPEPTPHQRIMKAREDFIPWQIMRTEIETLETIMQTNDVQLIRQKIQSLVAGFKPENEIVDWVFQARKQ